MGYDIATELSVKVLAKMRQERDSRDVPKIMSPVYQPITRLWDQEKDEELFGSAHAPQGSMESPF